MSRGKHNQTRNNRLTKPRVVQNTNLSFGQQSIDPLLDTSYRNLGLTLPFEYEFKRTSRGGTNLVITRNDKWAVLAIKDADGSKRLPTSITVYADKLPKLIDYMEALSIASPSGIRVGNDFYSDAGRIRIMRLEQKRNLPFGSFEIKGEINTDIVELTKKEFALVKQLLAP